MTLKKLRKLPCEEELVFESARKDLTGFSKDQVVFYFLVDLFHLPLFVLGVHELRAAFCSAFTSGVIFSKTSNELTVPSLI